MEPDNDSRVRACCVFRGGNGPVMNRCSGNTKGTRSAQGKWKLVSRYPDRWELYDIEADRSEFHDLPRKTQTAWPQWSRCTRIGPRACGVVPGIKSPNDAATNFRLIVARALVRVPCRAYKCRPLLRRGSVTAANRAATVRSVGMYRSSFHPFATRPSQRLASAPATRADPARGSRCGDNIEHCLRFVCRSIWR